MRTALIASGWLLAASCAPAYADYYVLACMRQIPYAVELEMRRAEGAQLHAYRDGLAKIAAELVRRPHPDLVKPLQDHASIILEAVAWDKSISAASQDNFDVHVLPSGTPQVCKPGFAEIGKFEVGK